MTGKHSSFIPTVVLVTMCFHVHVSLQMWSHHNSLYTNLPLNLSITRQSCALLTARCRLYFRNIIYQMFRSHKIFSPSRSYRFEFQGYFVDWCTAGVKCSTWGQDAKTDDGEIRWVSVSTSRAAEVSASNCALTVSYWLLLIQFPVWLWVDYSDGIAWTICRTNMSFIQTIRWEI